MKKSVSLRRAIVVVEDIIKSSPDDLTYNELIDKASQMIHMNEKRTLAAIGWLIEHKKIILVADERAIVWVAADNDKLKKLVKNSVKVL